MLQRSIYTEKKCLPPSDQPVSLANQKVALERTKTFTKIIGITQNNSTINPHVTFVTLHCGIIVSHDFKICLDEKIIS